MKNQKITTYQMAVTAVMAAVLCVLGPLTVPIGAIPISLANFVICLTAWLLGPKFGTLSVVIYLAIGLIGVPVFSGYGAGLAKVAGPTGGYLVGYLLLAFIGGLFIEKSNGQPVVSAVGLVLGDAACYVLGTAWFVFQMQCELGYALAVCVYPFIVLDLAKIVVSCVVGALLRKRLVQAGVLHSKAARSPKPVHLSLKSRAPCRSVGVGTRLFSLFLRQFLHHRLLGRRRQGGMLQHKGRRLCTHQALAHLAGIVGREGAFPVQFLIQSVRAAVTWFPWAAGPLLPLPAAAPASCAACVPPGCAARCGTLPPSGPAP